IGTVRCEYAEPGAQAVEREAQARLRRIPMSPITQRQLLVNRRQFFGRSAVGIGTAALASLLHRDLLGADASAAPGASSRIGSGGLPGFPNFAPKAKRVIYLMQSGGPPHVDMFDYKPNLRDYRGKPLPPSVQMGQRLS